MSGAVKAGAAVIGVGVASWLGLTYPAVYQAQREKDGIEREAKQQEARIIEVRSELRDVEATIDVLNQKLASESSEMSKMDADVSEARAKLAALENLRKEKLRDFKDSRDSRMKAEGKLGSLRDEWSRGSLLVEEARKAADAANAKLLAAQATMNPLNHRLLKDFRSSR